jgi:GNAT superfamily N-acetyltransferase
MIRAAALSDRERVIEILTASFEANPAVNDTIPPGAARERKRRALMEYLVDTAFSKEGVYITGDGNGAVLMYDPVAHPDRFSDTLRQLRLVHRCIGWSRLRYISSKDKKMRSYRPDTAHFYLSMIGTLPEAQGKGTGSQMIAFIQELAQKESKSIYLETSVPKNVEMYTRKGFIVHGDWKIRDDYHVHFMRWGK